MYTKKDILDITKKQLARDYHCQTTDFEKEGNTITENLVMKGSRFDESDTCFLRIISVGESAVISTDDRMRPWLEKNILRRNPNWLFDYGNLRAIDNKLKEFGHEIDEMSNFYLPTLDFDDVKPMTQVKWYEGEEIQKFKGDSRFDQAFVFDDSCPDVLGVAALDGDTIMGMAGASADSETLYQIGIDVLPEYCGKGIGTNLVALIKQELLKRGKIPFYGTSVSHIASRKIAIKAGFLPAWAEFYSKKIEV